MTITKREFMENVEVKVKDFRTEREKEKQKEYHKILSGNWFRKTYFVGEATMKEFFWLFHERANEFPDICRLDGGKGHNIIGSIYIPKKEFKSSYLISIDSHGLINIIGDKKVRKSFKAKSCKDVIRIGRIVRDMMK